MTAQETLAIVYAIEGLRQETRALVLGKDAVAEGRHHADEAATMALRLAREAVETETPPEHRRVPMPEAAE